MHTMTAYDRRETLSDNDLVRLKSALVDEVDRYRDAIGGYSPEKMEQFGAPYLAKLQGRVEEVERLYNQRAIAEPEAGG